MVPGMVVAHPEYVVLVRGQSGEGDFLKVVHDPLLLFRRHLVIRMPGQGSGGELPLEIQRINQVTGDIHIATQDLGRTLVAVEVIHPDEIFCRAGAGAVFAFFTTLAVGKDCHQHGCTSSEAQGAGGVSAFKASLVSARAAMTRTASMPAL